MSLSGSLKWNDENSTLAIGSLNMDIFNVSSAITGSFGAIYSTKNIKTSVFNNMLVANVTLGNQTFSCESCIHGNCVANETCVIFYHTLKMT